MTREEIFDLICRERSWQEKKYPGRIHSIGAICTILRSELREVEEAWCAARDVAAAVELIQVAAVAVAGLERVDSESVANMLDGRWER